MGLKQLFRRWSARGRHSRIRIGEYDLDLDLRWKHEGAYLKWADKQRLSGPIAFDTLAIEHFLKPGDVVLDAGANIGFTALYFLKCGAAKVHAFEPDPRNFQRLQRLQTDGKLTAYPEALGSETGELEFVMSRAHNQGSTLDPRMLEKFPAVFAGGERITVAVRELSSRLPGVHFDFMKIDVEGAEAALLQGARALLVSDPPRVILIECYEEMFNEVHDILQPLYTHHCRLVFHKPSQALLAAGLEGNNQDKDYFCNPPTYLYSSEPVDLPAFPDN